MRFSSLLTPFAKRFVAGETSAEALAAAHRLEVRGLGTILDYLGEDVSSVEEAEKCTSEYVHLLKAIHSARLRSRVSLKASQMGLLMAPEVCFQNVSRVLEAAQALSIFVWIDMEGSALTQKTVDLFVRLREAHLNIGLCVQAYLRRTPSDVERLIASPCTLRLCKGAYKEPAAVAFQDKNDVDDQYRRLIGMLLEATPRGVFPAFATHDSSMIETVLTEAGRQGVAKTAYEFQMLYGIGNEKLHALAKAGHRTQVYVPFGSAWLPYFMRRLRERRENIYFVAKNLLKS